MRQIAVPILAFEAAMWRLSVAAARAIGETFAGALSAVSRRRTLVDPLGLHGVRTRRSPCAMTVPPRLRTSPARPAWTPAQPAGCDSAWRSMTFGGDHCRRHARLVQAATG